MAESSLFSSSSSTDDDCAATASQTLATEEPVAASKSVTCHTQGRVTFRKAPPCTSNIHTNEQKPWGSGSPRRESTLFDRPYPTILSSPSKKCYGAPDLSTSKRSERDGKKTLAELRRVTKFPMVSASSKLTHNIIILKVTVSHNPFRKIDVLEHRPHLLGSTPAGKNRNDKNKVIRAHHFDSSKPQSKATYLFRSGYCRGPTSTLLLSWESHPP